MRIKLPSIAWMISRSVHRHSKLLTYLFQILLLSAIFEQKLLLLAEISLIVALLLLHA